MENYNKIPLIERIVVCGISKEKIDDYFNKKNENFNVEIL